MKYQCAFLLLAVAASASTTTASNVRELEEAKVEYCVTNYRGSLSRKTWTATERQKMAAKTGKYGVFRETDEANCKAKMDVVKEVCLFRQKAYRREEYSLNTIEFGGLDIYDDSVCKTEMDDQNEYCNLNPKPKFPNKQPTPIHEKKLLSKQQSENSWFLQEKVDLSECTDKHLYCSNRGKHYQVFNFTVIQSEHADMYPSLVDMTFCEEQEAAKQKKIDDALAERQRIVDEKAERVALRSQIRNDLELTKGQELAVQYCQEEEDAWGLYKQAEAARDAGELGNYELRLVSEEYKRHRNFCVQMTSTVRSIQNTLKHEGFTQDLKALKSAAGLERQKGPNAQLEVEKQVADNAIRGPLLAMEYPEIEDACLKDHVCARVAGDPHIKTFDGLKYDCQGNGEFVLVRDQESSFEIQGRFVDARSSYARSLKKNMVTITKAFSIDTGVEGAPRVDVMVEEAEDKFKGCYLNYYVDGEPADFGADGRAIPGLEFVDEPVGKEHTDFLYFPGSGLTFSIFAKYGNFGCMMSGDICLPKAMATSGSIVGLFGTPDGNQLDDWMTPDGTNLVHGNNVAKVRGYDYCTQNWCVGKNESIFGYLPDQEWEEFYACEEPFSRTRENESIETPSKECVDCCGAVSDATRQDQCLTECVAGGVLDCNNFVNTERVFDVVDDKCESIPSTPVAPPVDSPVAAPVAAPPAPDGPSPEDKTTDQAFSKGDPHFKTFGGELYDYHGECDLVLLRNPEFKDNLGMEIHIRTKIEDFWSSVESAAIKIGDETLEIQANPEADEWLWINGKEVTSTIPTKEWQHSTLSGFLVRYKSSGGQFREANVYFEGKEVLVFKTFKSFVRVDINWKGSENYNGSTGLLGSHAHKGQRLGREGNFIEDFNEFGQEWQVQEDETKLFHSYEGAVTAPNKCVMPPTFESPAKQQLRKRRLAASGLTEAAAEKACDHLVDAQEKQACVYDVIATQDLSMASAW